MLPPFFFTTFKLVLISGGTQFHGLIMYWAAAVIANNLIRCTPVLEEVSVHFPSRQDCGTEFSCSNMGDCAMKFVKQTLQEECLDPTLLRPETLLIYLLCDV